MSSFVWPIQKFSGDPEPRGSEAESFTYVLVVGGGGAQRCEWCEDKGGGLCTNVTDLLMLQTTLGGGGYVVP